MSTTVLKCLRCDGPMETGFIWSNNTVGGEFSLNHDERCGWMAGDELEHEKTGIWPLRVEVTTNQRRTLKALRCTQCGRLELYAL